VRTADFDFELPPDRIAQFPAPKRDDSRLLILHRDSARIEHCPFRAITEHLRAGDALVLNDSRVIPARLRGVNARSGGQFEILLLEENGVNDWWAMLRPGRRARVGTQLLLRDARGNTGPVLATVLDTNVEGHRRLRFDGTPDIVGQLEALGEVPLPPYIHRGASHSKEQWTLPARSDPGPGRAELLLGRDARQRGTDHSQAPSAEPCNDRERYQTVYARPPGSVAAPTAGLHFTRGLLDGLRARGVEICFLTLHVGLGTFAPVKAETVAAHRMHEERYELSEETLQTLRRTKAAGGRVVAVGTTTVRVLESVAARNEGRLVAGAGRTRIFIYPPHPFRIVDALLTNFHLPRSTLLMLVSAFAAPNETRGREIVLRAYAEAIRAGYRFFSYGDAMLLI
jgi:S-adenosylmethionine:tRNA ribosyltransferase-isomerase